MRNKLRDAIYGLAVGDALGVPYEFKDRGTFTCTDMIGYGTHRKPAGTWSDDTSMTLATCDSIREHGGLVDVEDIRAKFISWKNEGAYTIDGLFDIGNTTAEALDLGRGLSGEYYNGNGSLMRIIPLAFVEYDRDNIAKVSAITHAHEMSVGYCQRYVRNARALINGLDVDSIAEIDDLKGVPESQIQSSGFVEHTYKAALWCLANTSSFAECVLKAVNLGSDTDTTAAVAGALAGIVYGYEGIPKEWIEALRGKEIIESVLFEPTAKPMSGMEAQAYMKF